LCTPHSPRSSLFPYTTLFRSAGIPDHPDRALRGLPSSRRRGDQPRRGVRLPWNLTPLTGLCLRVIHFHGLAPMATFFRRYAAERSEEHTSELQSPDHLVCRLL